MQSQLQQSSVTGNGLQVILLTEPPWLKEYMDNADATADLWDWYAPELVALPFMDCPYLCDDGLLWKWTKREQVVDVTMIPMDDGDYEWLREEGWVVADECHYCC